MSEQTIRRALGKLQDDPDDTGAWSALQDAAIDQADSGMGKDALLELLAAARAEHGARREDDAVARLLEIEVLVAEGTPREAELQAELCRVLNEVLDDVKRALPALAALAKLRPDDESLKSRIAAIEDERKRWPELLKELMEAADRMEGKPQPQAAMLYTAAQTAYRYGLEGSPDEVAATRGVIIERLEEALELAPDRRETALLLERLYRAQGEWEKAAKVLAKIALEAPDKETRLAAYIRLARVSLRNLKDEARATQAYERVLDLAPGQDEAMGYLVDHFSKAEAWDYLVAVYEDALKARLRPGKELEIFFQIAMINWRMRNRPEAAEPYFEKMRRAEPAHPAMLSFFRDYLPPKNEVGRLVQILTDAQRAMPEGPERQTLGTELAKLSEETQGAGKAIEHWRNVLRQDATNQEARDSLRRLYYRTEAWPALVDLVRQQADKLPPNDPARVPLLRELMELHRDKTKQDTALVPVLNQLIQLEPADIDAVREQVRVFEALNRPRDLVTAQTRLAELEQNPVVKAELCRAVARQWLEKFSNIQNALDAYEKVVEQIPDDEEATAKLRELYGKRRAFKQLYDLLAGMRARAAGVERRELTLEMAKLAAERLDRGADAIALYWELVAEDPGAPGVLDALEKQAERDKDFVALAKVISHRVDQAGDDDAKIKLLEKLGSIYESRVKDTEKTIETWRRVLELRPGYPKAIRILREELLTAGDFDGLTEIYAQQSDWEGLADALTTAADRAEDPELRVALSWRVAAVYTDRIQRPERAARAYDRILAVHPKDQKAAAALAPIYESESQFAKLPGLYEILLEGAEDDVEKVRLLGRLRELSAGPLADKAGAFKYAREAFGILPNEEAREALAAAAAAAGAHEGYVDALRERLSRLSNAKKLEKVEERRRLQREVARVLATELNKLDDAVALLRKVVDHDQEDNDSIVALDRLLREARRADDLRGLYELRLERAESTSVRVSLLVEWAQLEEDVFADAARARDIYKRALELTPDDRVALRALARIELATGNAADAATTLEKDRDLAVGTERAEREVDLARLYYSKLDRPADALAAAVRALEIVAHDPGAIAVLEALEEVPAQSLAASQQLEREYEATAAYDKQAAALEKVLAGTTDEHERRALYTRLSIVHQNQRNDARAAFEVLLRAVSELASDLDPWDRLAELGAQIGELRKVADAYVAALAVGGKKLAPEVERELCERASILYEDKLSEPDAAIPYLVRILEADPADAHAFTRLKAILTARERWDDLQKMYDRAVDSASDPMRRVDLLSEMALVFEDILDDPARAAAAYERVLPIDPENEPAIRALDKLYQRESRFRDLARLLAGRTERVDDETRTKLENRLATLHLEKLDEPAEALRYAAAILERDVGHADARAIARTVMGRDATKLAAAQVLERVYLARDEARELDEVTAIRLGDAALGKDERVELLRRLAQLRDERLADDQGALAALGDLLPLDPSDASARAKLLDVGRRASAHERVCAVLGAAADVAEKEGDDVLTAEILVDQASVFENFLSDDGKAETVYRRILGLKDKGGEPSPAQRRPALEALERIYTTREKHEPLAEILALEVDFEDDSAQRRVLLGRLGKLREQALLDADGAIDAWRKCLEMDDADAEALEALDRLYSATNQYKLLVEVLRSRERLTDDADLRRSLLKRSAEVLASKLDDAAGAIEAYRTLLDGFGPDREILAAVAALYGKSAQHRDLAESLEKQLDLATESADRVNLLSQLGTLRIEHLEDLPGGLECYRDALTLDPSHAVTRESLEKLLAASSSEGEAARAEAAALLRPLYETENAGEKLLSVLEIQANTTEDTHERLDVLATAVVVAETNLQDPKRAFALAARGLATAADSNVVPWVERVERLAAATDAWAALSELYRKVEPDVMDDVAKLDMVLRVAELARTRLDDRAVARQYYVRALELASDDLRALTALERLYEEDGDAPALLDILKRRVEVETDAPQKIALLMKQAKLSEDKLADPRGAIEALEQIVENETTPPFSALRMLERLYGQVERWNDVLALLERQLGQAPDGPPSGGESYRTDVELHHAIGVVAQKNLSDVDRALDEFRTALTIDPSYAPTVTALEAMLQDEALRSRAAEILEPVYLARVDWKKVMNSLEVRLLDAQDPSERRAFLVRIAGMHEDEGKDLGAALATYARLLGEEPTNEDTWKELERVARSGNLHHDLLAVYEVELAKITSDDDVTARLAFRAGELAEQLGDHEKALGLYRRVHAVDAANRATFEAIDRLLQRGEGRAEERIALYREALDHRFEDVERVSLLRSIAELQRDARKDDSAAIDAFRELLEVSDRDEGALDALEALYGKSERFRDLADLLERRADAEDDSERAAKFRLALGKVLDEKLGDTAGAIDRYEQIVQSLPSHRGAIDALEALLPREEWKPRVAEILRPLYEGADDWRRLITLGEERLALASDVGEKTAILRETAKLWEDRGDDKQKAFDAIRKAWALDPEDGALRGEADRLAESLADWDGLVAAYELAAGGVDDVSKPDLLRGLATLHDERRDDPRAALTTLDRLHTLDPDDLSVLERLDGFATLLGDWPVLDRVLARRAEVGGDPPEQAGFYRRLGGLRRDMLDDVPRAIEAYEHAVEIEHDHPGSLDALIELWERQVAGDPAGANAKLVDLYQRRVDLATSSEEDLRYDLMMRRASVAEHGLADAREAIASLQAALAVRAGDLDAVKALERLYEAERMWPELMEAMRLRAATVSEASERIELRKRIAELQAKELDDPAGALEIYRQVLDDAATDEGAIKAVRAIGEKDDGLRSTAADILEPVLRSAGRHDDLVAVLELRLGGQQEPFDRARTLAAIARVHEEGRSKPSDAREALLRAFEETPDDKALRDDLERLAKAEEGDVGFRAYAEALEKKAGGVYDEALVRELLTTLSRIAETELKDDRRAAAALAKATEQAGDLPELLEGLDRLYARSKDWDALADILGRRIEVATSPGERSDHRARLAGVQIAEFGRKRDGLATLRTAIEEVPEHGPTRDALEKLLDDSDLFEEVAEALEPVYRAANDHGKLASLFERRIDRAPSHERTRLRLDLARVLEEKANDPAAAQRQLERALEAEPLEPEPMAELERLLPITGQWKEAADLLAKILEGSATLTRDGQRDLWVKVADFRSHLEGGETNAVEAAYMKALTHDPENVDILRTIEGLQRREGRERHLVITLRARAKLEGALEEKRTLLREAHTLATTVLKEDGEKLGEEILRELLSEDEANEWALEQLTAARATQKDWTEVFTLLMRRAELAAAASEQTSLRHEAARVARVEIGHAPQAIELYRELLDGSDGGVGDEVASKALRELYAEQKRWNDLADLMQRLCDNARTPEERNRLRVELSTLQRTELKRPDDAVDTLRAVLDEEPSNVDAVRELGALYEQLGKHEELAELLTAQIDRAKDGGELAAELALRVQLGELYAGRLQDPARAIDTYEGVLGRDARHVGALTALVRIHEQRGDREKGADVLKKLVDESTGVEGATLALKLAGLRAELKDDAAREEALRRALDLAEGAKDADLAQKARKELRAHYQRTSAWSELAGILVVEAELEQDPQVKSKHLEEAARIHLEKREAPGEAATLLEQATALQPEDRALLLLLCDALSASGRGKDAADVLRKIIESFGGKRSKELAVYHHRLAHALKAQGEQEPALAELDLAFKIDPGNIVVLRDLGRLALEANDLDRAQKTFRALLLQKLDGLSGITKAEVFFHLGEISEKQNDRAKAIQMYERAVETDASLVHAKERVTALKAAGAGKAPSLPPPKKD
ncbi:MAG: tetratricopeptide repeat protein [Myxococcales bacterium]|nr:tetratricopeptide repeat protein [Myxococcales bacterium]